MTSESNKVSKKILLGVTGGIAVYKSCDLVRLLVKAGHEVRVIMTEHAREFVTPLTFEVLSRNPVPEGMFGPRSVSYHAGGAVVDHVEAAVWCDLFAIAPATANIIGKLASGIADDLLTTVALAVPVSTPALLAPAMNTRMWENPILQKNLKILSTGKEALYKVVPPVAKELACGETGVGALASPEDIFNTITAMLGLAGGTGKP
ncbi:MAG: flavoprotein [Planctomycetota bacterium]